MCDTIIACENTKDEVNKILKELKIQDKIVWIESNLHNTPQKLNQRIQEEISKIYDSENILLLYGCCGNATTGLYSHHCKIVCPKVDDCISLYLGGNKKRLSLKDSIRSYFFTKGYIENQQSLYNEINLYKEKYGYNKTKKIYNIIFKEYRYIRVIDTEAYNIEDILDKTKYIAKEWHLKHEIIKSDLNLLYKALNKQWDEDFIYKEKGSSIEISDFIEGL